MSSSCRPSVPNLRIYRINTGSCNGCDVELAATEALARFGLRRLGCSFTEEPAQADLVLVTGPLTVRSREQVLSLYASVPEPKVTVAIGVCPISGGVFRDSYAVCGPLDEFLPVQVNVPGCPPRPQAVVAGVAEAVRIWREGRQSEAEAAKGEPSAAALAGPGPATWCDPAAPARPDSPASPAVQSDQSDQSDACPRDPVAPEAWNSLPPQPAPGLRGKMSFKATACVGCRMCEHVCAAGAIRIEEQQEGLQFTLWHNSCAFCGLCSHYCPTKALTATGDWQLAHRQAQKYSQVEQGLVPLVPCAECGAPMLPVAPELLQTGYRAVSREIGALGALCTDCRQIRSIGGLKR